MIINEKQGNAASEIHKGYAIYLSIGNTSQCYYNSNFQKLYFENIILLRAIILYGHIISFIILNLRFRKCLHKNVLAIPPKITIHALLRLAEVN